MSEWKLVDVEGIGSGYACLTLDGVSTTKSRNLIQADRGAGGDGLGFSDLGTLLIDYADRDIDLLRKTRGSAQKHFHTDATTGRRCESAFALLSHQKVTKRLPYR